jgi:hypothetical protein
MATDMYSLPQLLPQKYTDDSVIPAIICNVIPGSSPPSSSLPLPSSSPSSSPSSTPSSEKKKGIFNKLRRKSDDSGKESKGLTKVVYMPRREYMKYFARDLKGEYVGTEPFRRWSEGELSERFREFQPVRGKKVGYKAPT